MPTETSALKTAVSQWESQKLTLPKGEPPTLEMGIFTARAQAIAKSNPAAVAEFKEKWPHFTEPLEAMLASGKHETKPKPELPTDR